MSSPGNRRNAILASLAAIIILIIGGLLYLGYRDGESQKHYASHPTEITPPANIDRSPATVTVEATPGLVIYGVVSDQNGAGVADVVIYRNYASYPGEVVATTDAQGSYESNFYAIPGDEMVGVWAEKAGFEFEPQFCRWRHYYGYERARCDFLVR